MNFKNKTELGQYIANNIIKNENYLNKDITKFNSFDYDIIKSILVLDGKSKLLKYKLYIDEHEHYENLCLHYYNEDNERKVISLQRIMIKYSFDSIKTGKDLHPFLNELENGFRTKKRLIEFLVWRVHNAGSYTRRSKNTVLRKAEIKLFLKLLNFYQNNAKEYNYTKDFFNIVECDVFQFLITKGYKNKTKKAPFELYIQLYNYDDESKIFTGNVEYLKLENFVYLIEKCLKKSDMVDINKFIDMDLSNHIEKKKMFFEFKRINGYDIRSEKSQEEIENRKTYKKTKKLPTKKKITPLENECMINFSDLSFLRGKHKGLTLLDIRNDKSNVFDSYINWLRENNETFNKLISYLNDNLYIFDLNDFKAYLN